MTKRVSRSLGRLLAVALVSGSLAGTARSLAAQSAAPRPAHTKADAEFMQGMIAHHAQAIVMGKLVPSRTKHGPINSLAERIVVSQRDEIRLLRAWLLENGEEAPDPLARGAHQHGAGHDALMPGMLTAADLAELEAAKGPEFERLFLQSMIRHHEGAITMVATLFASPGAGQDLTVFRMASDIEADQRAEITRMRALLKP